METRICISIVFYLKPKVCFIFCFALRYLSKLTSIVTNQIFTPTTFIFCKNYSNLILFAGKILETMYDGAINTTIEMTNVPTFSSKISGIFMIIGTLST